MVLLQQLLMLEAGVVLMKMMVLLLPTASQKNKVSASLENTQEMEMLMEHLFTQDSVQLGL